MHSVERPQPGSMGSRSPPVISTFLYSSIHLRGALLVTLSPLFDRLAELGYGEFEEEGLLVYGFPVQFLSASPGLESEAVRQASALRWDDHVIRVMTPEHLAAIALTAGRPKDRARLVYLVSLPAFDRAEFGGILNRHGLQEQWLAWSSALGI